MSLAIGTHPYPGDPGHCGHDLHGADGGPCPRCGWDSHPIPDTPATALPTPPWETPMTPRLTITLCGSLTRATDDLNRVHRALALAGHLVHAPVPPQPDEPAPTPEQLHQLTDRHYEAIRRADLVLGVIPDGLAGHATQYEMRFARQIGKTARWVTDINALLGDIAAGRLDRTEVAA